MEILLQQDSAFLSLLNESFEFKQNLLEAIYSVKLSHKETKIADHHIEIIVLIISATLRKTDRVTLS